MYKIVCFTCKRDESLLPIHYNHIRKINKDCEVYYIVDAGEIDEMTFPKGSIPLATDFNRNENLTGLDALKGIISVYSYLGGNILKIDTDTLLLSEEWITEKASMIGFAPSKSFSIHGSCYYINQDCVMKIKNFISNYYYGEGLDKRCEDQVITQIASIVSEPYKVLILPSIIQDGVVNSCIFTSEMFNEPDLIDYINSVINCGDMVYLEPYLDAGLDRTIQVRRAMEFVIANKKFEN